MRGEAVGCDCWLMSYLGHGGLADTHIPSHMPSSEPIVQPLHILPGDAEAFLPGLEGRVRCCRAPWSAPAELRVEGAARTPMWQRRPPHCVVRLSSLPPSTLPHSGEPKIP